MDIDMEAAEEAAPPESKVKLEPPEMPVTRQRAVGGGAALNMGQGLGSRV